LKLIKLKGDLNINPNNKTQSKFPISHFNTLHVRELTRWNIIHSCTYMINTVGTEGSAGHLGSQWHWLTREAKQHSRYANRYVHTCSYNKTVNYIHCPRCVTCFVNGFPGLLWCNALWRCWYLPPF
jgi:hypothetical protein